jgi:hypothetical protein
MAVVIGKIWLIGRAYAAAIERRKGNFNFEGDDFYVEVVAPRIINSGIDSWLSPFQQDQNIDRNNMQLTLKVHADVTNLFYEISGLKKRSLASKYLHFHFPNLFYIYDSRAQYAISKLTHIIGRVGGSDPDSDHVYRKFAEKCMVLQSYIANTFSINLTPRELDNLLLELAK